MDVGRPKVRVQLARDMMGNKVSVITLGVKGRLWKMFVHCSIKFSLAQSILLFFFQYGLL